MVLQLLRLRVVSATERFQWTCSPRRSHRSRVTRRIPAPRIAEGLAITRECVRDIAGGRRGRRRATAIVLMPARFQVDDADYGRLKEAVAAAGGELLRDAATERFDAALAALPLPRVDAPAGAPRARCPGPTSSSRRRCT